MRLLLFFLCWFAALPSLLAQTRPPEIAARAWVLLDYGSGQMLASGNIDKPQEPAALSMVMTSYLVHSALREKKLRSDQMLPVSERASRMPGTRSFAEVAGKARVEDLLKGMVVQSGSDAAVVLAEAVAGSEDAFVSIMNWQARLLGMSKTRFLNASGHFAEAQPKHSTTAGDLTRLAVALIRTFPEAHALHGTKEFSLDGLQQYNSNRLLWIDPMVDGLMTGNSRAAGFSLIGTAKRGERRLVSVVLGAASDDARTQESLKLLNYGFQAYEGVRLYRKDQAVSQLKLFKGAKSRLAAGFNHDFIVSLPKGTTRESIKAELVTRQPLLAPVQQGTQVGLLKLSIDNHPWGEFPVYAQETVPLAGIFGRAWDTLWLWLQ
jgi:D-alanyl-D-alanine carboxypeptidase (penicillin-binding protein 5/6)